MFEILHQVIARPADAIPEREDKVRLLFANFAILIILGATEIALVIDSTEQSAWGFLASVNALSIVGVFGSLGLQVTLKILFPAWCLSVVSFLVTLWWAGAAFGIDGQGGMFAVTAMAVPWFTFIVCQNERPAATRNYLIFLAIVSTLGLVAAVVVHALVLISVVPMSPAQYWIVLAAQMLLTIAAAVSVGLQLIKRAEEAERVRFGQMQLEERLSVAMELVREPVAALVQLASSENPPHPASVVSANLTLQAVNDLESVVGFNAQWANFRSVEIRPLLKSSVSAVERHVQEVRDALLHTSSAQASRRFSGAQSRILGDPNAPPMSFALRVHDGVPNYVMTDDRRLSDVLQEIVYSSAQRALHLVTVLVTFQAEGTWLEVRVIDDGLTLTSSQENSVLREPQDSENSLERLVPSAAERRRLPDNSVAGGGGGLREHSRRGFLRVPTTGVPRVARVVRDLLRGSLTFERGTARRQGQDTLLAGVAEANGLDATLDGSVYSGRPRGGGPDVPKERGNTMLLRLRLSEPEVPGAIEAGLASKRDRLEATAAIGAAQAPADEELTDAADLHRGANGFRAELPGLTAAEVVRSTAEVQRPGGEWWVGHRAAQAPPAERAADALGRYFPVDPDGATGATREQRRQLELSRSPLPTRDPYRRDRGGLHATPWTSDDEDDDARRPSGGSQGRTVDHAAAKRNAVAALATPPVPAREDVTPRHSATRLQDVVLSPSPQAARVVEVSPRREDEPVVTASRAAHTSRVSNEADPSGPWPWLTSDVAQHAENAVLPGNGGQAGAWWPPPRADVAAVSRMKEVNPVAYAARHGSTPRLRSQRLAVEDDVEPAGEMVLAPQPSPPAPRPSAQSKGSGAQPGHQWSSPAYDVVAAHKPLAAAVASDDGSRSISRVSHSSAGVSSLTAKTITTGGGGGTAASAVAAMPQRYRTDAGLRARSTSGAAVPAQQANEAAGSPAHLSKKRTGVTPGASADRQEPQVPVLSAEFYRGSMNGGARPAAVPEPQHRDGSPSQAYRELVLEDAVAQVAHGSASVATHNGSGAPESIADTVSVVYDRFGNPIDPDL